MIDSIKRLIEYVNIVKPYHSKILDVSVQYDATEKVVVGGPGMDSTTTVVGETVFFDFD